MKIASSVLVCASFMSVLLASSGAHAAVDVQVKGETGFFKGKADVPAQKTGSQKEDDAYWARLMQESMSVEPAPTPPPTPGTATPPPTGPPGECLVNVTITCTGPGDVECNELEPPPAQCAVGTEIDTVSFVYNYCSCEDEDNGQGEDSTCEDTCSLEDEDEISVSCTSSDGTVIFSGTTAPGEEITLPSSDGASLSDEITCDLGTTDGNICQTVSINTSGTVDLQLKDKFGSLELVSCDDNDCLEEVTYSYTLENIGEECMTITVVERTRNGETENLIDLVPDTELCPGDTTVVTEMETVDLCEEAEICTVVDAEADPPAGAPCFDTDEYCLIIEAPPTEPPTPPPTAPPPTPGAATPPPTAPEPTEPPTLAPTEECDITIEIACIPIEFDDGGNASTCEQLPPLVTICEERPTWMQFKYYGGDCSQSANMQQEDKFTCTDLAPIPQDAPVFVNATDKDGETLFFAGTLEIDDLYNITDPNGDRLPADMRLNVFESEGGPVLQEVQYHSSCSQNLFLKDRYGAHQLVAFFNTEQGLVDCFITSNYTFTFGNMGTAPAVLESLVALTTPFGPFNLTDQVLGQDLAPGDEFVAYLPIELDLTVRQRYTVLATITGSFQDDTPTCSSSDFLDFVAGNSLPPSIPTSSPTASPSAIPA